MKEVIFAASERLVIAPSTGSVGIGTTAPDKLLHLSSSEGTAVMRFSDTRTAMTTGDIGLIEFETFDTGSPGVGGYILGEAGGSGGQVDLAFAAGLGGSATEVMRIISEGNVGIGTATSINSKLKVEASADGDKLSLENTTTGGKAFWTWVTGASNGVTQQMYDNTNTLKVFIRSYGDSYFNGGKVGIGTASPDGKLCTLKLGFRHGRRLLH